MDFWNLFSFLPFPDLKDFYHYGSPHENDCSIDFPVSVPVPGNIVIN